MFRSFELNRKMEIKISRRTEISTLTGVLYKGRRRKWRHFGVWEMIVEGQHLLENVILNLRGVKKSLCFVFAAIDYIHFLHKEKKKQEEEVSVLRKEVKALNIMKK